MDRLSALIIVAAGAVLLASCEDGGSAPPASSRRVDSVKATKPPASAGEAFCDVRFPDASAPTFALPALAGAAPAAATGWRWVNVWATWCKPCIEEFPRLEDWRSRLAADGHPVSLVFLSADASDADVTTYRAAHPGVPDGARIADAAALAAWATTMGLDATASIPIHVLVDPADRVRCARAGAVRDTDFPAVAALLR
jgi:thiol-disulfide isomerase/thioredoxin